MARAFTSLLTPTFSSSISSNPTAKSLRRPILLFSRTKSCSLSFSLSRSSTSTSNLTSTTDNKPIISEGTEEDLNRHVCPGCGVFMQDADPNLPGYYIKPSSRDGDGENANDGDDVLSDLDEIVNIEDEVENRSSKPVFDDDIGFSDLEEFDLNSDGEDTETSGSSQKNELSTFIKKIKSGGKQSSDKFVEIEDKLTNGWSSKSQFGEEVEDSSDFDALEGEGEGEEEEFDWDSNFQTSSKKSAKSKSRHAQFKSSSTKSSSLDQFLQEEEENDAFSDLDFEDENENEEFDDLNEEDSDCDKNWDELDEKKRMKLEMQGFAPPGAGYGKITEEYLQSIKKPKISKSDKKKKMKEEVKKIKKEESLVTVCARCFSLRNYGLIKNPQSENLIPDFDFDRFISTRLMTKTGTTSVVVLVVDCTDFDGSFPKSAVKSLFNALEGTKKSKLYTLPKIVLVGTKVDLLPNQVSAARLEKWVRGRAKTNGAHKLDAVLLVSSHKDLNIRNLITSIKDLAGPRGNVWVVGAQNAGKSTLINALAKKVGVKISKLTEAALPGTTLGILRVTGILPAKVKMFDTPGLLHQGLVINKLNRDEQKMVEIKKELKPHSFRIKAGQAVHVGGLMRLDLIQASIETIYVTVWASPSISLHMGKIANADELREKHFGVRLQPPIGQERVGELGEWTKRAIKVSGSTWDMNSVDIAVAGLGWFSVGLKGEAKVELWTFEGVEVAQREPLVLDRARILEKPGFWLPKAISDEIGRENKKKSEARKKLEEQFDDEEEEEDEYPLFEASFSGFMN